ACASCLLFVVCWLFRSNVAHRQRSERYALCFTVPPRHHPRPLRSSRNLAELCLARSSFVALFAARHHSPRQLTSNYRYMNYRTHFFLPCRGGFAPPAFLLPL